MISLFLSYQNGIRQNTGWDWPSGWNEMRLFWIFWIFWIFWNLCTKRSCVQLAGCHWRWRWLAGWLRLAGSGWLGQTLAVFGPGPSIRCRMSQRDLYGTAHVIHVSVAAMLPQVSNQLTISVPSIWKLCTMALPDNYVMNITTGNTFVDVDDRDFPKHFEM